MALTFADTHNMIAYLTKSDVNDAESIDCLPNEEIFTELSRMRYEKPSTKLTFYKAFFSPQWKFLIHTSIASAVIYLSICRKFNFSRYIFDSLVRNVDSSTKFYMYPRFLQLMIRAQVGDLSSHSTKYSSHALTQKVFANMRRVGKGFLGVDIPLFEGMLLAQQVDKSVAEVNVNDVPAVGVADEGAADVNANVVLTTVDEPSIPSPTPPTQPPQHHKSYLPLHKVEHLEQDKIAQALEITKLKQRVKKLERKNKLKVSKLRRLKRVGTLQRVDISDDTVMDDVSKQGRIISDIDTDVDVTQKDVVDIAKEVVVDAKIEVSADVQGRQAESQAQIYQIDLEHADKVLSMQDDELEPAELQEVVEVVTTAKLMTKVVTAASATITVVASTLTTAPSTARSRKGVVIRDPEETATPSTIIHSEAKSKDKRKGILVEEPKPLKKQAQIKHDEAFAREDLKVNDVTRLQALVDMKKVRITEAKIQEALRLDDAESIDCLPNEEIFTELSKMGGHHGTSSVLLWLQLSSAFQQFQATASIKKVNDFVKLRWADGVEYLPNEEIFIELARMGYEKPPPKLTFYKAFFSAQ
nr:hypothetical protein [Tanacetum cinerariifolium]